MNNAIEVSDAEQFVKGESSRDLQVSLDARDLAIQETIDTVNDFFRFLEIWSIASGWAKPTASPTTRNIAGTISRDWNVTKQSC